jgi:hypothetical protein
MHNKSLKSEKSSIIFIRTQIINVKILPATREMLNSFEKADCQKKIKQKITKVWKYSND